MNKNEFLYVEVCPWIETLTDVELVKELESLYDETPERAGTAWDNFEPTFKICRDLMKEYLEDEMPLDCEFLGDLRKILAPGLTHLA